MQPKPRARDLGLPFPGTPGPLNAITDVPGVAVGFCTLTDPARDMRTGVTAILPRPGHEPQPVWAGHYALNGNGEMTGTHWIDDAGYFLGPVLITNTHGVGAAHMGATRWMIDHYAEYFTQHHAWAMPVVAETYDGVLNDINALHVEPAHAIAAIEARSTGPVAEGSSGGGNGMICYEFKGGTGTSSRRVAVGGQDYTVAALVQANHGLRPWLNILGRPVGELIPYEAPQKTEMGSIIVVIATDAPLSGLSLRQLAKRAAIGIGRHGTPGGNSSGDIFLAFSTANPGPMPKFAAPLVRKEELTIDLLDPLYLAAVQAIEESVVNAMVAGEDVDTFKPKGGTCRALNTDRLREIFASTKG
ncbi:P1 family peptidase [Xinfangfangia sp. CPCC 101601]|uniref:P1 family peptidase n=1 Tax=Pseudogemmobacter lacusdianii TaxID=3069608 RepID=A0ABU0W0C3_9RHOB|nr:P1 family peptidase [Xinfangfangia sp. CPCC 101601]MDQ2067462.1 P1 family peptidase [Xinfangfangia sp. CPCC 101601]